MEIRLPEDGPDGDGTSDERAVHPRFAEVGPTEVAGLEYRSVELGPLQARADQHGSGQVGALEVRPVEGRPR